MKGSGYIKQSSFRFTCECDGTDALVLIDRSYLDSIDDNLLYALDILLDRHGETELAYDFPDEEWENVWARESKPAIDFCNSGRMAVFMHYKNEGACEISFSDVECNSGTVIDIKSGRLILVSASELIQCLACPDLEMETLLEIDAIRPGKYSIRFEGPGFIRLAKSPDISETNNVIELL